MLIHGTKDNFSEKVLKNERPVLVDFWASWCQPCRMLTPILEDLAKDVDGLADIVKINVDEEGELAGLFRVMSIPTLLVFKNGKVAAQTVGVQSKDQLKKLLDL